MSNPSRALALGLLVLGVNVSVSAQETAPVRVQIETDHGTIEVEIDMANAPRTSANFLQYVDGASTTTASFTGRSRWRTSPTTT